MLVGLPAGALNFVTVWIAALVPRFFPSTRVYTGIGLCSVPLLGAILLITLPAEDYEWGIVVATWLAGCVSALLSTGASMIASNVKGNTKKSIVSAGFFVAYCIGCLASPQAWTQDDAPRYTKGCILSIASLVALIFTFSGFVVLAKYKNRKRDQKAEEGHLGYVIDRERHAGISIESDLTDIQDKAFRYTT